MLTYQLEKRPGLPLYEALYRAIREDILSGRLEKGARLPSARTLAAHLEVSRVTVQGAYDQLLAEGYLRSQERVGVFVDVSARPRLVSAAVPAPEAPSGKLVDFTGGAPAFPFAQWMRLERSVMLDWGEKMLEKLPNLGLYSLRQAIANHLRAFRGMEVQAENILVGAGTDFLYNLLIQLLGRDKRYALEEPGYSKIRRIYQSNGVSCCSAQVDGEGLRVEDLGDAQVVHATPLHHFPTGAVISPRRRRQLLQWLEEEPDRYLIEDDYDSEFRLETHPLPALCSLDGTGRVIYMNSFSKTLAPSLRISYMILPPALMEEFQEKLGFYSCTLSGFLQYTLEKFLREGYFEKHLNRMRRLFQTRRQQLLTLFTQGDHPIRIREHRAGLHFLVEVETELSGEALVEKCRRQGILVRTLAQYYHGPAPQGADRTLVIDYSGLDDAALEALLCDRYGI